MANPFWDWLEAKGWAPHGPSLYHNPSLLQRCFNEWCVEAGADKGASFTFFKEACSRSEKIGADEKNARIRKTAMERSLNQARGRREAREWRGVLEASDVEDNSAEGRDRN